MRKGLAIDIILSIIIIFILLVVNLTLFSSKTNPVTKGPLGLPGGAWISVESADTKTFVLPPVLWFGDELTLNGKTIDYSNIYSLSDEESFIFSKSVQLEGICIPHHMGGEVCGAPPENSKFLEFLIFTLYKSEFNYPTTADKATFKFDVEEPIQPPIAFYPLVTDDFTGTQTPAIAKEENDLNIWYLKGNQNYGKIKFIFKLDLEKLKNYYESKGYIFEKNTDNIKLGLKYGTDGSVKESFFTDSEIKKLTEIDCSNNGDNEDEYICEFEFNSVKECCPSSVTIQPLMEVKLISGGHTISRKEIIYPISFVIVYYFDKLSDRQKIFDNFDSIIKLYSDKDLSNLNIYPCRSIVDLSTGTAYLYSLKGINGLNIDWGSCESSTSDYTQLNYKDSTKKSTWYCKYDETNLKYYLYNPYAFCKLKYDKENNKIVLPSTPKVVYLQKTLPSGKLDENLDLDFIPDTPQGIYNEAAAVLASYVIYKTHNFFSEGSGSHILFAPITAGSKTINFEFN